MVISSSAPKEGRTKLLQESCVGPFNLHFIRDPREKKWNYTMEDYTLHGIGVLRVGPYTTEREFTSIFRRLV